MKNSISFTDFLKKYWWLIAGLCLLLIIPVAVFCFVFSNDLDNASAWASMIAGVATYLGSAFLGVLVFYNSWVQNELNKQLDDIDVIFDANFCMRDGCWSPFKKEEIDENIKNCYPKTFNGRFEVRDFTYVGFEITNNNFYTPITVSIEGIYYLNDEQKIEKCKQTEIHSNFLETKIIDYKTSVMSYYGVPASILKDDYYKTYNWTNCMFVFRVANTKGAIKYYVKDFWFAKSILGYPRVLTESQYKNNLEKLGTPINITHFNKQLVKRIGQPI